MAAREGASSARRRRDRQLRASRGIVTFREQWPWIWRRPPPQRSTTEGRSGGGAQGGGVVREAQRHKWSERACGQLIRWMSLRSRRLSQLRAWLLVFLSWNAPPLGGGAVGVDGATVRFLLVQSLLERQQQEAAERTREEERKNVEKEKAKAAEKEAKMLELNEKVRHDMPLSGWHGGVGSGATSLHSPLRQSSGKSRKKNDASPRAVRLWSKGNFASFGT